MKTILALICILLLTIAVDAQYGIIQANEVKSGLHASGPFFQNVDKPGYGFQVPYVAEDSPSSIYSAGLWLSAITNQGQLLTAYSNGIENTTFIPGPINTASLSIDFNKVWKVDLEAISKLILDYQDGTIDNPIDPSILEWPAKGNSFYSNNQLDGNFAPFNDINNNGIYEPLQGDYPAINISGNFITPDELLYTVYHDPEKTKMEVHAMMYAFKSFDLPVLNQSVFIRHRIVNRNEDVLNEIKVGHWSDPDVGCIDDDYLGYDTLRRTVYTYNADPIDGKGTGSLCNGWETYMDPPVITIKILNQAVDKFITPMKDGDDLVHPAQMPPSSATEINSYLNGQWFNEQPITYGNAGLDNTGVFVNYMFPGNPNDTSSWNMKDHQLGKFDIRSLTVIEKNDFLFNDQLVIDAVANATSLEGIDQLTEINAALKNADLLQECYNAGFNKLSYIKNLQSNTIKVFPNPTSGLVVIEAPVTLTYYQIHNTLGQLSQKGLIANNKLLVETSLPFGTYFITFYKSDGTYYLTKKLHFSN